MIVIRSFWKHHTEIVVDALDFTKDKVIEYCEGIITKIGESHRSFFEKRNLKIISELIQIIEFLSQYPDNEAFEIDKERFSRMSTVIRSALEIYAKDLLKYDIEENKNKYNEIEKICQTEMLKNAKKDLFTRYAESLIGYKGRLKLFISYSSKDKKLAGKIGNILKEHDFDIFLAHRDIPMSEEWRNEILYHLENCSVLLALCTTNYISSTWGNQEVGIALQKEKIIIPVFYEGTEKSKFGFLEAKQGPPKDLTRDNLKEIIESIIDIFNL